MEQELKSLLRYLTGFGSRMLEDVGIGSLVFVMLVSLACGVFVAHLYRHFYGGRATGSQIHRAFPLLSVSITSIFISIQFSLPLSLGLLGALSIVRFRTPIKEPEEIGFLMLVIACSIGCATFNFAFLGVVLLVAVVGLVALRLGLLNLPQDEGLIVVPLPADQYPSKFAALVVYLDANTRGGKIESVSKTGETSVISYTFRGLGQGTLGQLQAGLGELVGDANYDIFVNHQRTA